MGKGKKEAQAAPQEPQADVLMQFGGTAKRHYVRPKAVQAYEERGWRVVGERRAATEPAEESEGSFSSVFTARPDADTEVD